MSYFEDDRQMYIPESVDSTGVSKQGYFTGDGKVIKMVIGFIPYMVFLYLLLQLNSGIFPIILMSIAYLFIYSYYFRFVILEETRLKKMLAELDANNYSEIDHFWGINKISSSGESDGMIQYENNGVNLTRALVVGFDKGSTVGVPQGHYALYRKAKEEFIKQMHLRNYDFMWYEIPARIETPKVLDYYFNVMTRMPNNAQKKLLKLQIEINTLFANEARHRYVDYIVIKSHDAVDFINFKTSVEYAIAESLTLTNYIVNPHILSRYEIDAFLEDLLMIKSIDSTKILKGKSTKTLEDFGEIITVIDAQGHSVLLEEIDSYDLDKGSERDSLEYKYEKEQNIVNRKIKDKERERTKELEKNRIKRQKSKITDEEFKANIEIINDKYDSLIEDIRTGEDVIKSERELQERIEEKKRKREKKHQVKKEIVELKEKEVLTLDEDIEITMSGKAIDKMKSTEEEKLKAQPIDYDSLDDLDLDELLEMEQANSLYKETDDTFLENLEEQFSTLPQDNIDDYQTYTMHSDDSSEIDDDLDDDLEEMLRRELEEKDTK